MKFLQSKTAIFLVMLFALAFSGEAYGQKRLPNVEVGSRLVKMNVGEITLERIDFRNQTAQMSIALDVSNSFIPVNLKDFDYRLNLYGDEFIEGNYGDLRLNGNRPTRLNLPVTVNLRSIPSVVWQAFKNRGQIRYQLDTGFTLPLYFTEKRFDKSFAGEVPLKSLVDAASILRASQLGNLRW
ncbi:MAG: LEA type 2 family protein [Acidobacteriota bacterium]|nr:LEA type 2 family protein [Acidobacteriota bacterium]